MSGDKLSECSVSNAEIRLFNTDTHDLDECQLGYIQDNTGIDILFYKRML